MCSIGDTKFSKIFSDLPMKGDLFNDLISDNETMRIFLREYARKKRLQCNEVLLRGLQTHVYSTPLGYVIESNVHPSAIVPGHFADGWQALLPMIHDYQLELRIARSRSADLLCGEVSAQISSQRLDLSINRAIKSQDQLTAFEQFAFSEARPFGQAFEAGTIKLGEALKIIDDTAKFREWLRA